MAFETTRWSLVVAAAGDDSAARDALGVLCQTYWYPLYAYLRRRGIGADDAGDLIQGFLTSLIERRDLGAVGQARGRFRAFLLASLQHYVANEWARQRALKRGGGKVPLPLAHPGSGRVTSGDAEGRYHLEPIDTATPETLYERRWALAVIEQVLASLRREWESSGRGAEFEALSRRTTRTPVVR